MKTHMVYFSSFLVVSCFEFIIIFYPTFSAVCHSLVYLFMRPRFIISIEHKFPTNSDFFWLPSNLGRRADVCARTTPDP
ncbi:uncharacterized protein EDB93DRAFT_1163955 [Suillus bovinus]|uniref:uncharacterized protein n=1 Tax=Suillus bovinus TaxID=48563 RepID=UPI001B86E9D0|nr:uncharacterized protein EDB93DRAFT_1163955 [Suillus bovinus]KAG2139207.1 hypothetical protein EDB93DRAFT_1163955 [Suillus bovinus]